MKLKSLFFILFPYIFLYSQTSESIARLFCKCEVINYSQFSNDHKIVFISNDAESFFGVDLNYHEIQKVNGQWVQKRKYKISFISKDDNDSERTSLDEFSFADADENAKEISRVKIYNTEFYYSIIQLGMSGTAYNGMNAFLFIFQDVNFNYKPVKLYYEKWDGEFVGSFKTDDNLLEHYVPFIEQANIYISKKIGISNDDINSVENFHLKWLNVNNNTYRNLDTYGEAYISPVQFPGINFFNAIKSEYNIEEKSNSRFQVIAGFKAPVVVYDKTNDISLVVYIPEGWPNGGAWGYRSLWPEDLYQDRFTIKSEHETLFITLNEELSVILVERIAITTYDD